MREIKSPAYLLNTERNFAIVYCDKNAKRLRVYIIEF